jgi:hypothetical protein
VALDTITEPFYMELGTWAPHNDAVAGDKPIPAGRHATASFSPTRNPSWDEADISDKPKWVRDTVPNLMTSAQRTFVDESDIESRRAMLAVDEMLYDIVRKLTTLGMIDRTIIIVVSDNGALTGEHRMTTQTLNNVKNVPYQPSIHSRAFIHYPAYSGRHNVIIIKTDDASRHHFDAMGWMLSKVTATNTALVGNIDIAPTICDLFDATPTRRPDGMSMVPLLDGRISPANFRSQLLFEYAALVDSSIVELPSLKGVVTADGRKFVRYEAHGGDPAETEYYDAAQVAADELVASQAFQPDLDAAITAMVAG